MKKEPSFIPYLALLLLIVIGVPVIDYYAQRSHEIEVEVKPTKKMNGQVLLTSDKQVENYVSIEKF